ncbi:hypothetical protein HG530_012823 [Fusarium avenaceum]|nr:hypothetical protein HG530_012823 [Fusarium avenaceum]
MNIVFSVLAVRLIRTHTERMESGISIPPQLESLDCAYALYFAEAICTTMNIGPDNVDIVEIDQILPTQISLKLDRAFDCRELISDCDVLVMYTDSFIGRVSDSVRFLKSSVASTHSSVREARSDSCLARAHGAAQNRPLPRALVGGRPSDDEVKDEPEDDMLSLEAVEGDLADRAVGTCHDTVTTA